MTYNQVIAYLYIVSFSVLPVGDFIIILLSDFAAYLALPPIEEDAYENVKVISASEPKELKQVYKLISEK